MRAPTLFTLAAACALSIAAAQTVPQAYPVADQSYVAADGTFPRPVTLYGKAKAWPESLVQAWIAARIAASLAA